jgi:hypothetical protein
MNSQLLKQIVNELAASQLHWLLWFSAKWTVLGALIGLITGIVFILLFKRFGWYQSGWRLAGWVRWPLWIFSVMLCALLAATAGLCKGLSQGAEQVLQKSQLATKVFPVVGGALADGLAGLQSYGALTNSASRTNIMAQVEAFRAGEWELNVPKLHQQLDELSADAVSNLAISIETNLVARSPQLQSGLPGALFHHALVFGRKFIVERKIHSEMKDRRIDAFYDRARNALLAAAKASGAPETLSRQELSDYAVQQVVVPSVMWPLRIMLNEQKLIFVLLALLAAVVPGVAYRFTLGLIKAKPVEPPPDGGGGAGCAATSPSPSAA